MPTLPSGAASTSRRQSCDRCHRQKLRCPRPSNGDSGPCERCTRSKAQCVYSSSLPKGRPSSNRQNRMRVNAPSVGSPSGGDKATSGGINFGVDNDSNSAIVTEMNAVEEQHLNQTATAIWGNPHDMDWMGYINNTFPESEPAQWHPTDQIDLAEWDDLGRAASSHIAMDLSSASEPIDNAFREQMQESPAQVNSHRSCDSQKEEPETAVACLSRLSHRLYSLYSAVLEMVNSSGELNQADTTTLQTGPFADDSAFQKVTGWIVRASSSTMDPPIQASDQQSPTQTAEQDGCTLLNDVFSASRDLLNTLHSLNTETSKLSPYPVPHDDPLPLATAGPMTPQSVSTTSNTADLHPKDLPSSGHWSNSIVRHMVMACHMLLLNTYLAVTMALQHATDKQKLSQGASNAEALPLGEVRTVMIVQLCGYLIQRQSQAVQAYLASPGSTQLSDESMLHNTNPLSSSDQAATKQLEQDVEQRLARLRQSLNM